MDKEKKKTKKNLKKRENVRINENKKNEIEMADKF